MTIDEFKKAEKLISGIEQCDTVIKEIEEMISRSDWRSLKVGRYGWSDVVGLTFPSNHGDKVKELLIDLRDEWRQRREELKTELSNV